MKNSLKAELVAIKSTRTFWAISLFLLVSSLLAIIFAEALVIESSDSATAMIFIPTLSWVWVLLMIFAATQSSGHFRHGTVTAAALAQPSRVKLALSQTLATILVCVGIALVCLLANLVVGALLVSAKGFTFEAEALQVLKFIGVAALCIGLLSALAAGIGLLLRIQVLAAVVPLVWLFIFDPIVSSQSGTYLKYSLFGATTGALANITDSSSSALLTRAPALLVIGCYLAVIYVAGIARFARDDIN